MRCPYGVDSHVRGVHIGWVGIRRAYEVGSHVRL